MSIILTIALALQATAEPGVFRVADYGALPDTAADSGPAVRRAVAAAMAHPGRGVVQFDAGVYRVAPAEGAGTALPTTPRPSPLSSRSRSCLGRGMTGSAPARTGSPAQVQSSSEKRASARRPHRRTEVFIVMILTGRFDICEFVRLFRAP